MTTPTARPRRSTTRPPRAPERRSATAPPGPAPSDVPPVLVYVPGTGTSRANTSRRVAQILARTAGDTAGPWHVDELAHSQMSLLSDAHRIMVGEGSAARPVLDVCTYDYRDRLAADLHPHGTGVSGALRQVATSFWYFLRVGLAVLAAFRAYLHPTSRATPDALAEPGPAPGSAEPGPAEPRPAAPGVATSRAAKDPVAKVQLLVGLGAVGVLFWSLALAVVGALAAFGVVTLPSALPDLSGTLTALTTTAAATWLWTWFWLRGRPVVLETSRKIQSALDYAEDERFAAGVAGGLATAIDELLDAHPGRKIHLLGYSLGALVAMDFVFPRPTALPHLDPRHRHIESLTTIGSPADFVLLFFPGYVGRRIARNPSIRWDNVFNASDVFGSNFLAQDDVAVSPDDALASPSGTVPRCVTVAGRAPVNHRFTSATLRLRDVWVGRGFTKHVEYWGGVDDGHCFGPLVSRLLVRSSSVDDGELEPATVGAPRSDRVAYLDEWAAA